MSSSCLWNLGSTC